MNISLSSILDEAKVKREGHLKTLNMAMLAYVGIALLLALPSIIAELSGVEPNVLLAIQLFFDSFLTPLLTLPLLAGITCLGLARAREQEIRAGSIFKHYNKIWPLFGFTLISWLFGGIVVMIFAVLLVSLASFELFPVFLALGIIAGVLLGIYISILINFSMLIIVDQGLGVIGSIKRSIAAVRLSGSFSLLFKFYFMLGLWTFLGLFTLGIAYFWIIPKYIIAYGIIYRDLFDRLPVSQVSPDPLNEGPLAKYN